MITAYVTFDGNTEEAFEFYKTALNGTITGINRFGEAPNSDQMSEADRKKVMHIALEGPNNISLMGNDHVDFMGAGPFNPGNNFSLSFHPDSKELADQLFNNLSAGGTITVPMSEAPWGDYFGMFTDKFGIKWMINHRKK